MPTTEPIRAQPCRRPCLLKRDCSSLLVTHGDRSSACPLRKGPMISGSAAACLVVDSGRVQVVAIQNTGHPLKFEFQNNYLYILKRCLLSIVHLKVKFNWVFYTFSDNLCRQLRPDSRVAWLLSGALSHRVLRRREWRPRTGSSPRT